MFGGGNKIKLDADLIERAKQVKNPDGYFEKPFDEDALLAKVKELIG